MTNPYATPEAEPIDREFRIIRRSRTKEVLLFSPMLLICGVYFLWTFWEEGQWPQSSTLKAMLPILIVPGLSLLGGILGRRVLEKKIKNHPAYLDGRASCASSCSVDIQDAGRHEGLLFLTEDSIILDLQEVRLFKVLGPHATSRLPLASISHIAASREQLSLSGTGFFDLQIKVHDPRQWRERIEKAASFSPHSRFPQSTSLPASPHSPR